MSHEARYSKDTFQTRLGWQDLDPDYLRQLVGLAKIEDLAGAGLAHRPERLGDVTTALMPEGAEGKAQVIAREPLVVCGLGLVQTILDIYGQDCHFEAKAEDRQLADQGEVIGILSGASMVLLQAERVILNFLQHLSGVATEARLYVEALGDSPSALLDTRKTLPGYRVLQKYAFACGGGYNHRIGLFDRVMLKDNHLAAAGAIGGNRLFETVALAVNTCEDLAVEVEVDRLEQITPALEAGADIILLDNFSPHELIEAVSMVDGRACTEASGGITLKSLPALGELGLDFISSGAPIHQSRWKDIGLDWL
jgi:nicotinate-nucleotide pyrophosphorylase (carboxylating)